LISTRRSREIAEIISDLKTMQDDPLYKEAVADNIAFFKATRCPWLFLGWLILNSSRLKRKRDKLLELGDFPFLKWQKRGYAGLASIENHRLGGMMSTGFVRELCRLIQQVKRIKGDDGPVVVLDLGCGGGEMGRLVFKELSDVPLAYIGVDITPANIALAERNFRSLHKAGSLVFTRVSQVDDAAVDAVRRGAEGGCGRVATACFGDIFGLDKSLSPGKADIIWHSRVLHHISRSDMPRLEEMCRRLSPLTVEMDDVDCFRYKFWTAVALPAVFRNPSLLNGMVISRLRDPFPHELTGHFKLVSPFSYVRLIMGDDGYFRDEKWRGAKQGLTEGFSFR